MQPFMLFVPSMRRAANLKSDGFGRDGNDSAGLIFEELDKDAKIVVSHPKVELKTASPYKKLKRALRRILKRSRYGTPWTALSVAVMRKGMLPMTTANLCEIEQFIKVSDCILVRNWRSR